MRRVRAASVVALVLWSTGCSSRLGTVGAVLTPEAYPPAMVLATGATGEDCGSAILFVTRHAPRLDVAIARAVATVPEATLLTEVDVATSSWTTGFYGRSCVRVRGSAAKLITRLVLPAPEGHHGGHSGHH